MRQPKPLVTRGIDGMKVVLDHYTTMASGLHGTHSFENLIGISTYKEALREGIDLKDFKTNGDDQNVMINGDHVDSYMEFMQKYFKISWEKSLVGHRLGVWGKL
jgi:hypothetical protein